MIATLAFGAMASVGAVTACLSSLPDATLCPAAAAHSACPRLGAPGGPGSGMMMPPAPSGSAGGTCTATTDSCILQQFGGDCACRDECTRTSASCFPPPDCPASVKNAEAQASCLAVTASAPTSTCLCGCPSCASICDGQGPVAASGQALRFDFPSALTGGRVGVMVRLRGSGHLGVLGVPQHGTPFPIGDIAAPSEFSEILATSGTGPPGAQLDADRQPVGIELQTDPTASVEIDCVVPYVAP
jgi:hypothetical protein